MGSEMCIRDRYIADQQRKLATGGISRRQFIASMIAAGVVLPGALSMSADVLANTPKKGGKLRIGLGHGSTTDSLDPGTYENRFSQNTAYMFANHLTEVDSDGQLVPELAESFETYDAKTWVFKLRKGVEFHNGCLLYTSPSPRDLSTSRMPSSA